ncbi:hypothetical protein A9267_06535 [Shewanella sp. UCD-FRSSP16_17]|uniref:hypothetical protein n=1 Tax=unclassified Shewanella TaxID=196818 RepID=UPI0007EEAB09|nr:MULTISPECIES: hypothetical protein [unclassified Shewanella]MBQ4889903.1 hypothetical protein [Shewanella sp. MMG014]OBT10517.1 hypothetical protein A9267_06535 [Shewanella sp. UCD-FRSSP16_17]
MILSKREKIARLAYLFGLLGLLGLFLGISLSVLMEYIQFGDQYSLLQFSISELGTYNRSSSALWINGGLFFGSLSLTMSCLFGLQLSRRISSGLFWFSLIVTFIALAATGLFPLNVFHLHIKAVSIYIYFGLLAATFCFIECAIERRIRLFLPLVLSFVIVLIHGSILAHECWRESLGLNPISDGELFQAIVSQSPKPDIWWLSILFWCSIVTMWLWILSICRWYFLPLQQGQLSK